MKRLVKLLVSVLVRAWDIAAAVGLRLIGRRARPVCVVIYYHAIDAAQRSRFARQMDDLLRLTRPVSAGVAALPGSEAHYAAVTFDDGFISVLENALPELEQRKIPATFFVPTGCFGGPPAWVKPDAPARQQRVLTVEQLVALRAHPILEVASHSISHPNFLKLDPGQARRELAESKARLESILGHKVPLFSFPHGKCDTQTIALARSVGYERVFTINPCNALAGPDNFVTGRVLVDPADWPLEFRLKILGAYRWLARRAPAPAPPEQAPATASQPLPQNY